MQIVTAAVIEQGGKILIAKRRAGDRFAQLWEFPGGKLEPGESPGQCLQRELREELGVETRLEGFIGSFPFASPVLSIELVAYKVSIVSGRLALSDHEELRWVSPAVLGDYSFTEPDLPLLKILREEWDNKERDL
ncbi:MAG: (deoxy)nucleoside triphosphate pyrophosphohydrolase [Candidatus Aminicenantes bacterium]|nr:(deoxy)nucleoside triphosphate pyrophosphohydrolase [Candidatus Aminicenantes bacterium]